MDALESPTPSQEPAFPPNVVPEPDSIPADADPDVREDKVQRVWHAHDGRILPANWKAGQGRKPGTKNKLTLERNEFIEMVVGEKGSPERAAFAARIRQQIMDGTCAPQIALFFLQHWLGKPKETIEIHGELGIQKIVREIVDPGMDPGHSRILDVTPEPPRIESSASESDVP